MPFSTLTPSDETRGRANNRYGRRPLRSARPYPFTTSPGRLRVGERDAARGCRSSVAHRDRVDILGPMLDLGIGTNGPSLRSLMKTLEGLTMNPILFLSLVIILSAALPWWPYSAYGRSRHRHPWDWLLDTPSREDYRTWQDKHALDKNAYETKIFNQRDEAQSYTGSIAKSGDQAMRWQVENSPDEGDVTLLRQFKERWIEAESNRPALSPTV